MTATQTARRSTSRTARAEAAAKKLAAVPSETPKPQPKPSKPAPQPKPAAIVDLGAKPVTYWFPSATLADGTVVVCVHSRYGHESEASAKRCISALVAQKGHQIGAVK